MPDRLGSVVRSLAAIRVRASSRGCTSSDIEAIGGLGRCFPSRRPLFLASSRAAILAAMVAWWPWSPKK
jgi:hypothetical protein